MEKKALELQVSKDTDVDGFFRNERHAGKLVPYTLTRCRIWRALAGLQTRHR